jgi:hypothetical protein
MRDQIADEIERALRPLETRGTPGLCLYFAHIVALTLHRHGLRPCIQAGSLQWPRMTRAEDDGQVSTHFAYMWAPEDPRSRAALAAGRLPEIHAWVGLPDTQELIDFSTRHLKDAARAAGLDWTADDPPPFVWARPDALPDWVVYTPNRQATLLAAGLIWEMFQPEYLIRRRPRNTRNYLRQPAIYGG